MGDRKEPTPCPPEPGAPQASGWWGSAPPQFRPSPPPAPPPVQSDASVEFMRGAIAATQLFAESTRETAAKFAAQFIDMTSSQADRIEQLEIVIRRLRGALEACAHPSEGWPETWIADAFEASRAVVPDAPVSERPQKPQPPESPLVREGQIRK